jgi:hypothetical protein
MVVKNLQLFAHGLRTTDSCTYICEHRLSCCRLKERGLGIIPVAGTMNGTCSALCFHMPFPSIGRSWYFLHFMLLSLLLLQFL